MKKHWGEKKVRQSRLLNIHKKERLLRNKNGEKKMEQVKRKEQRKQDNQGVLYADGAVINK